MVIRKAEKKDAKASIPLLLTALDEMTVIFTGYENEEEIIKKFEEFFSLEEGRYSYKNFSVCEVDGKIAGIVVAYYSDEGEKLDSVLLNSLRKLGIEREYFEKEFNDGEYYIDSIAVSSEYQGRGIAKKLINFVENEGKKKGYKKMSLIVHENKEKPHSIYKKLGYEEDELLTVYSEKYRHMVKNI